MIDLQVIIRDNPNRAYTFSELATLLKQKFPDNKRSVNIALAVYESGIASKISKLSNVDYSLYTDFIKQLTEEYGLTDDAAIEGVMLWAKAYSVSVEQIKDADVVTGVSSDYEITEVGDGIVISKFRGFDEENMTVPNMIDGKRVVGIGEDAYANCFTIKNLVIPKGIQFIEGGAFKYCNNLTRVALPESLNYLGYEIRDGEHKLFCGHDGAFENTNIMEVALPKNLKLLGKQTFCNCKSLKKVEFNDEIDKIEYNAFRNCTSLESIVLPQSIKTIGEDAFYGCINLTKVILNDGLLKIGRYAFGDCNRLEKILFPRTLIEIEEDTLGGRDLFTLFNCTRYNIGKKNENVTIYCYPGSYALDYARKKGLKVKNTLELK